MATASQDFSSKRHFHYTQKLADQDDAVSPTPTPESLSKIVHTQNDTTTTTTTQNDNPTPPPRRKPQSVAVSRLRSAVLAVLNRARSAHHHHQHPLGLGPRVVGTLFGNRRGHVHLAFQKDPTSRPAFLIELATPISTLVREMASGLVRITLECEKLMNEEEEKKEKKKKCHVRLLEEAVWKTYCNGKKCGFATRRDCGAREWEILKAVEPISMGAGVLPGDESGSDHHPSDGGGGGGGGGGEVMYMRAKFERIVGSRDSEAFYMMNPDSNGAPELSLYLLRV